MTQFFKRINRFDVIPLTLLLVLAISFSSCKSGKNQVGEKAKKEPNKDVVSTKDKPFLIFERTACFGACPTFKMTIMQSGKAYYHGEMNVKNLGEFEALLSDSLIYDIAQHARKIHFFEFNDVYDALVTDLPATTIFMQFDEQEKNVSARFNIPDELQAYILYLQKVSDTISWQSVEEK